jgi:transposase
MNPYTKTWNGVIIGCDLSDKINKVVVLKPDDSKERHKVQATPEAMRAFFAVRAGCVVIIEVGTHSRWVANLLASLGLRVVVANPRRLKLISTSDKKTDWNDAELLARLGRADEKLLSPITHRSNEAHADLAVAKSRDVLVATRTKIVNHVRSVVKTFGVRLKKCTAESFRRQTHVEVPAELKIALDPLYEALKKIDEQIKLLDKRIEQIAKKYPDVEVISQIDGVGTLTALVFLLTIEDKNRFAKSRTAGAYFGLRPRNNQSGEDDPQLRITKAGDMFVRRLLVNSANYILGPFGKDSDLRTWGLKHAEQGGKNARKRAKVAVARKLAVLMHRLWVTGEVYQPIGYKPGKKAA